MKRIVFIFLTCVGIQRKSLACYGAFQLREKTDLFLELQNSMDKYLTSRDHLDLPEVEKVLKKMKAADINMNTIYMQARSQHIDDANNNTPLHYALAQKSESLSLLVYFYFNNINLSLQNHKGYTVPMLAAGTNQYKLLEKFLVIQPEEVPMNFAIKKRKSVLDKGKTVLDYAKGKPEVETVISNYDAAYQQAIVDRVMINAPRMLKDLAKIIAGYATPVVADDLEADKEYREQEDKVFDELAKTHQRKISR